MTLAEYHSWQKFFELEPAIPERVDLAGALISSTLANVHRGKNTKAYSIEDFLVVRKSIELKTRKVDEVSRVDSHMEFVVLALGGRKG